MGKAEDRQRYAELARWGRQRELNELDTLMWRTERHPSQSWTGVVLMTLETEPDWDRFRHAMEWAMELVPRFTEKVVDPALPTGTPIWVKDDQFDLDFHLTRIRLPEPGTHRQALDYAQRVALDPLDKSRPPWTGTLITGLENGRAAFLFKAQHVILDGTGATLLFSRLLNPSPDHIPDKDTGEPSQHDDRNPIVLSTEHVAKQIAGAPKLAVKALGVAAGAIKDPAGAARYAASLARVLQPPAGAESEILRRGTRRHWKFGTIECPLPELKAAGKSVGGTVNDTFVSILLGGMRFYFGEIGEGDMGDVPISMPVSMRTKDDDLGGNRFAGAFFSVPSGVADPAERIKEMRKRVEKVRAEPALDFLGMLTPVMNRAPSSMVAAAIGAINSNATLTTSSWPGVVDEVYMAGAKFDRMFTFGPLPGTAMCGAMCTHGGVCCIGINVDGEVFEDTELLWECMQRSMDETLALAPGSRRSGSPTRRSV
jgi:WS/DGAT/MGAT family acyltransferase